MGPFFKKSIAAPLYTISDLPAVTFTGSTDPAVLWTMYTHTIYCTLVGFFAIMNTEQSTHNLMYFVLSCGLLWCTCVHTAGIGKNESIAYMPIDAFLSLSLSPLLSASTSLTSFPNTHQISFLPFYYFLFLSSNPPSTLLSFSFSSSITTIHSFSPSPPPSLTHPLELICLLGGDRDDDTHMWNTVETAAALYGEKPRPRLHKEITKKAQ